MRPVPVRAPRTDSDLGYSLESSADARIPLYVNGSFVGRFRESDVHRIAAEYGAWAREYAPSARAVNLRAPVTPTPFGVATRLASGSAADLRQFAESIDRALEAEDGHRP